MKLITKKSKAILSTCIAISIAGGAVFANVTNEANGTIGSHTNINIATSPVNGQLDGTTGASVMITNGPNAKMLTVRTIRKNWKQQVNSLMISAI